MVELLRRASKLVLSLIVIGSLMSCHDVTQTKSSVAPDYASAALDLSTPQNTAYSMMIAMYRGDAEMIDKVFIDGAALRRIKPDGSVEPDGLKRWRDWVGTLEVGQAHEELFGLKVEQFENLATVWAPFVITYNGEIAGCGVNQLSMARRDGDWRIVSGMDTAAPKESCASFKKTTIAQLRTKS